MIEAGRLKAEGVRAGMPDFCVRLRGAPALWLEIKTGTGEPTKAQREMMGLLTEIGDTCAVVRSLDQGIQVIEAHREAYANG